MIGTNSVLYISKALLLKNFNICLILIDLALICVKIIFSIKTEKKELTINKVFFFYNQIHRDFSNYTYSKNQTKKKN